jgi:ribosomal protein S18 acetylase RimI-like enzyme
VIGWCDVLPGWLEGLDHCGELGMGVRKDHRRRGIGQRLLLRAIEEAKAVGLERIELDVFATNVAAIRLYEKLGFGVEGLKQRARKIDGRYDDI